MDNYFTDHPFKAVPMKYAFKMYTWRYTQGHSRDTQLNTQCLNITWQMAYCKDLTTLADCFIFYDINKAMREFNVLNVTVVNNDMIGEL